MQPTFQRQVEVEVGAAGKSDECCEVVIVVVGSGIGSLFGSIGSILARIDVPFDVEEGAREALGTKAGARGSGMPALPKMLTPPAADAGADSYAGRRCDESGKSCRSPFPFPFPFAFAFALVLLRKARPYAA